ncbi:hypothetical protein B0A49_05341, partial [Cryomyces minteri]
MADGTPTQNFSFTKPNPVCEDNQRNYIFVNEHNRHKRVKEPAHRNEYYPTQQNTQHEARAALPPTNQHSAFHDTGLHRMAAYADLQAESRNPRYDPQFEQRQMQNQYQLAHDLPSPLALPSLTEDLQNLWQSDHTAKSLSGALGELQIDATAIAPYIANEKRRLTEAPTAEAYELSLPQYISTGLAVRIPPEMMPIDYKAMQYFDHFFTNIHPYVPVINRSHFYQQWKINRESISPLILEGIFACSSRFMDQPAESDRWLALAS